MSKKQFRSSILFLFSLLLFSQQGFSVAFSEDSLGTKKLKEVTVHGQQVHVERAVMPVQAFSEKELDNLNATNVSDVAKHFAGVSVKDYGGIGGLKTVSIRGLGAQHTGVSYDGVMLSDVQTGQIDLSRYSLDNVSEVSVFNGQPNDIFQTARMFSYSGVLCIVTKESQYNPIKTFETKVTAKTGSFGLANVSVLLNKNFNKKWNVNFSTDALSADGKYQFVQHYGGLNNLSEELTRKNSDITSIRSELNATYHINENDLISIKSNYLTANRGLPENVFRYGLIDQQGFSVQRLKENYFFSQLHFLKNNSISFQQQVFAKFNSSFLNFTDMSYYSEYTQREFYSSYSAKYQPFCGMHISISADWWLNDLNAKSMYYNNYGHPTRNTELVNFAAKYSTERFVVSGNILGTYTQEHVQTGPVSPNRQKISPSISFSYKLFSEEHLHLRTFYKDIFRVPTFNDLYYQEMGNTNLRPESTKQYNVGIIYQLNKLLILNNLEFSVDGYYNNIKDKIVASPKGPMKWTIENKDFVEIKGVDLNFKSAVHLNQTNELLLRMNYTYNNVTDLTPGSPTFWKQIPYTPFTSGSGSLTYNNKYLEIGYNLLYSGLRWVDYNSSNSLLSAYAEHSIYISSEINKVRIKTEMINILDTQYEIIKFYPMPGRNYRITLSTTI